VSVAESHDAASLASDLDPRDHIDRKAEQELFLELVTFQSPARILTICDRGGRGKSSLLKRLRYNCQNEVKPPVPSCLVELDKLGDPSPFALATAVATGFRLRGEDVGARFAKFKSLNSAREAKNFGPFEDGGASQAAARGPSGRAAVRTMHAGSNIGQQTNIKAENATVNIGAGPEFTEDQEQRAKEACVEAFFDDLRSICASRAMVLMLDGWERCNSTLSRWIVDRLLADHVLHPTLEMRPKRLAVVIAGRPYVPAQIPFGWRTDELREFFDSEDDFAATVRSVRSLSEWDNDHIREFMVLNGCPEPTVGQIVAIRELLAAGGSLVEVGSVIGTFFKRAAGVDG
jgi:hypothetical protein